MDIVNGIMFIIFAAVSFYLVFAIEYNKSLKNKICVWILVIVGIFDLFSALTVFGVFSEPKAKEYPASEYRMSIKTSTMDNQTDTTYVISKKRASSCYLLGLPKTNNDAAVNKKEYPVKEYRLSIKTTTMDNQTDTIYVITKIR